MDTFGEWLRGQRDTRRLTREEFANRVGCSVAMLRKMEDDERRPSVQIAELIAACLDIPLDERGTFVKVARGELPTSRIGPVPDLNPQPGIPSAQTVSKSNLPVLPTPLVGRQREVDELSKLLKDPPCRLLSIVGPGGIGKTRLAIETVSQAQPAFADGVYFVPLAPVQDPNFIVPAIADAIGFIFQGERSLDPKSQLFNYFAGKHQLLVIDNLEQLLTGPVTAEFFAELLERATRLKLVVTSRESLGLQSEWVFDVHGLPIPDDLEVEGTSVELFLQRARRAHVGFNATSEDYPAIVRICRLVDGMPLGIELAAAWVRTLSCDEIADEIERGLDFLSVSAKDLPARHRSIRAVFDHSWELLPEVEQNVLMCLSIFQGGFSRDAAQQIANATLPALSALVTKSLIRRNGSGRYDLHETIRQYALERLGAQPQVREEAEVRHGKYFMTFLSQQDIRLRSSEQREALAESLTEIDNLRSAQEWALAHEEFVLIETAMRAYSTLFDSLGWAPEALDYLERVISVLEPRSNLSRMEQVALAHVLTARSLFAYRMAQHEQARSMLERSLEILRPLNEPRVLVETLTFLGIVKLIMGSLNESAALFREGLQTARDINDQWYEALCLTELFGVERLLGEEYDFYEQFQTVIEAWRRTGDLRFTALGLNTLSLGAIETGKFNEARAALEESIAINSSIGDRWGLGTAYRVLALSEQAQEEHLHALDHFNKSLQIFTELGARWDVARLFLEMGGSAFALGNVSEANDLWRESLRLSMETHGIITAMGAIVGIARVHALHGNNQYALQLLLFCIDHPAAIQEAKIRAGKLAAELKEKLTPSEIKAAQTLAKDRPIDDVVKEILA